MSDIVLPFRRGEDLIGIGLNLSLIFVPALLQKVFRIDERDEFFRQQGKPVPFERQRFVKHFMDIVQNQLERNRIGDFQISLREILPESSFDPRGADAV